MCTKSANYHGSFDIKGVLSVEHSSGKAGVHDGVWLTLFATTTESSTKTSNWINVNNNQELKQKILKLIHDVSLVPLYTGYH